MEKWTMIKVFKKRINKNPGISQLGLSAVKDNYSLCIE